MPKYPLAESFRWYIEPINIKEDPNYGNRVRVKGIAISSGVVSKNNRKYTDREVRSAARTLINKKITVNHDNTKVIGNIEDAEFEDGNIEYVGYINKQPYVDKMRDRERVRRGEIDEEAYYLKWNVYPINGVSIDGALRRTIH
jgi:hypothetical protein